MTKPAAKKPVQDSSATTAKSESKTVKADAKPVLHTIKTVKNRFFTLNPLGGTPSSSKQNSFSPVPGAYSPGQLETAYGVSLLGLANEGQGVTVGIVDEFNDADIIGDAETYSMQYGLPLLDGLNGDPTLAVNIDSTLGSVGSAAGTDVAGETSLDVEMVHAMAPMANILLVKVPATGSNANAFAELLQGGQFAATQSVNGAPVVAVSTSYGLSESSIGNSNVVNLDNQYLAAGTSTTVAMTFSSGDGSTPLYPATSPNVVAVGGTSLYLSTAQGRYFYETAWGGLAGAGAGGGGTSNNFSAPSFQPSSLGFAAKRSIPDVSMVGDPVTGVSIYDSLDEGENGGDPWEATGGTSVASPLFAGILALTQQNRIQAGQPILNSVEINTALYEAYESPSYATYFHDVTLGNNSNVNSRGRTTVVGFKATTGYDLATGIGSPIANTLVPYLANYVIGT